VKSATTDVLSRPENTKIVLASVTSGVQPNRNPVTPATSRTLPGTLRRSSRPTRRRLGRDTLSLSLYSAPPRRLRSVPVAPNTDYAGAGATEWSWRHSNVTQNYMLWLHATSATAE